MKILYPLGIHVLFTLPVFTLTYPDSRRWPVHASPMYYELSLAAFTQLHMALVYGEYNMYEQREQAPGLTVSCNKILKADDVH